MESPGPRAGYRCWSVHVLKTKDELALLKHIAFKIQNVDIAKSVIFILFEVIPALPLVQVGCLVLMTVGDCRPVAAPVSPLY